MSEKIVTLDVREDLQKGREPFGKIMKAVAALKNGQSLRLIAPFRPAPLFAIMTTKGFSHRATATPQGDWEVLFTREPEDPPWNPSMMSEYRRSFLGIYDS